MNNHTLTGSIAVLAFAALIVCLTNSRAAEGFPFCATATEEPGSLYLSADAKLDSLISVMQKYYKDNPEIDGYRIQLHFTYSRNEARKKQEEFLEKFPGKAAYLIYEQPYFKVRVGNYRNLVEAQAFYYELLKEYGNVFLVPTKIDLPPLKTEQ